MHPEQMKYLAAFILLLSFLGSGYVVAQSGRGAPAGTDSKRNNREVPPSPSSSPPSNTNSTAEDSDVIKVETDVVTVPIRVLDRSGRFIGGLQKDDFKVFDEGVEQEITHFSTEKDPFTVALVIDMSYSSKFKISEIQSAAISFIDQLGPNDKVSVVSFDQDVHLLCEPTSDRQKIYRAIMSTKIQTGTSLYDAIDLVANHVLRGVSGRKAIILFTDGVDTTSSTASEMKNLSDASELDALIFPISYDTFADVQRMKDKPAIFNPPAITHPIPTKNPSGSPFPLPIPAIGTPGGRGTTEEDYRVAREYLDQLALRTGGTNIPADSAGSLNTAFAKIASELREYYSVGFYPSDKAMSAPVRHLKVKVTREGAVVRSRDSYSPKKRNAPAPNRISG
jgi:Ca-activated chloride channel homolog